MSFYELIRSILLDNWRHFFPKSRPAISIVDRAQVQFRNILDHSRCRNRHRMAMSKISISLLLERRRWNHILFTAEVEHHFSCCSPAKHRKTRRSSPLSLRFARFSSWHSVFRDVRKPVIFVTFSCSIRKGLCCHRSLLILLLLCSITQSASNVSTQSGNCYYSLLQALVVTFSQEDLHVFRYNLDTMEQLNVKFQLYSKVFLLLSSWIDVL